MSHRSGPAGVIPTAGAEVWHRAPYAWALQEAGFREWTWYVPEVAPDDVAYSGETYWRDCYDNCPNIGLVCQK